MILHTMGKGSHIPCQLARDSRTACEWQLFDSMSPAIVIPPPLFADVSHAQQRNKPSSKTASNSSSKRWVSSARTTTRSPTAAEVLPDLPDSPQRRTSRRGRPTRMSNRLYVLSLHPMEWSLMLNVNDAVRGHAFPDAQDRSWSADRRRSSVRLFLP